MAKEIQFIIGSLKMSSMILSIVANVKVLCAVWGLMHYTFSLAPKLIKGTNAELTTSAHIAQNTCYRQ